MPLLPKPTDKDIELLMGSDEAVDVCEMLTAALRCHGSVTGAIHLEDGIGYGLYYPEFDKRYKHNKLVQRYFEGHAKLTFWPNPTKNVMREAAELGYNCNAIIEETIEKGFDTTEVSGRILMMYAYVKSDSIQARIVALGEDSKPDTPHSSSESTSE